MRRRPTAVLLLLLTLAVTACGNEAAAGDSAPESTYAGAPADYRDDGVLLVVTWAEWASVWPLTHNAVEEYRATRADTDVQYVNADRSPALVRALGSDVVPSVIVIRNGRVVAAQGNVTDAGDIVRLVNQQLPE
jgi:ABC-type glycerol-3-phosphate transport system substrate-binding protein